MPKTVSHPRRSLNGAGGGGAAFSANIPGTGQILGGRPGVSTPKGISTSVSNPETLGPTILQQPITAPENQPLSPSSAPLYGSLEIYFEAIGTLNSKGPALRTADGG